MLHLYVLHDFFRQSLFTVSLINTFTITTSCKKTTEQLIGPQPQKNTVAKPHRNLKNWMISWCMQ